MSFNGPYLKRVLILALFAGLLFTDRLHAATEPAVDEKIISAVLKDLARAFTATADLEKIKKENIAKIARMDEDKFRERSAGICSATREISGFMREKYGVTPGMTKEQAISAIRSLDKPKIYEIINTAPDVMLARLFKECLSRTSQHIQSSQLAIQIRKFWDNLIKNTAAAPRHSK